MTSASPRIDKRRRTYIRLVGEIHHALNAALNEEKAKRGLNMTKIAKILGVGRSAISRKFDGRHNMTLETLADLAFALDRPVRVELPERISVERSNHQDEGLRPESKLASITTAFMQDTGGQARSATDVQQDEPQQTVEASTMPRIASHIDQTTVQRRDRIPVYGAIATFGNARKALFEQDQTGAKQ